MKTYDYEVVARLIFFPTEELNSKGNPVLMPVVTRKMLLSPKTASRPIQVVRFSRGGEVRYCFSELVEHKKDRWLMPKLRPDPPPRWKKIHTLNEQDALVYLGKLVGSCAAEAMHELINKEPTRE